MAGYMRKLNGYVYDGAHTAGEALENGVFAEITAANGVKKITAAGDMVLRVQEKTTLWGAKALVLDVVNPGTKETYFVENEWDINDAEDYNEAEYTCKVGDYVKMHRPVINDQLVLTVGDTVYAAVNVGDNVKPAAGGSVAKATT